METYDYVVIGGGIVGLSTALHLGERFPGSRVLVLEKESSAPSIRPAAIRASFTRESITSREASRLNSPNPVQ